MITKSWFQIVIIASTLNKPLVSHHKGYPFSKEKMRLQGLIISSQVKESATDRRTNDQRNRVSLLYDKLHYNAFQGINYQVSKKKWAVAFFFYFPSKTAMTTIVTPLERGRAGKSFKKKIFFKTFFNSILRYFSWFCSFVYIAKIWFA